jgi:hypothetical protein
MYEQEYAWACEAAKQIGWLPQVVFSQWVHETGWFKSNNFKNNKNLAGQTWYEGCGYPKGTARPRHEGGYYIKYPDPVRGYVSFIMANNRRYGKVKDHKTVEDQVKAIAAGGWAADLNYASSVLRVYRTCLDRGIFNRPVVKVVKEEKKVIHKYVSLVDYLKAKNLASDFHSRRNLAVKYHVVKDARQYAGTAEQNRKLLENLQS